jgi:hypothetical protein
MIFSTPSILLLMSSIREWMEYLFQPLLSTDFINFELTNDINKRMDGVFISASTEYRLH